MLHITDPSRDDGFLSTLRRTSTLQIYLATSVKDFLDSKDQVITTFSFLPRALYFNGFTGIMFSNVNFRWSKYGTGETLQDSQHEVVISTLPEQLWWGGKCGLSDERLELLRPNPRLHTAYTLYYPREDRLSLVNFDLYGPPQKERRGVEDFSLTELANVSFA